MERALGLVLRLPVCPPLRRFGVPPGGPFDRESALLAQALGGQGLLLEISGSVTFRAVGSLALAVVAADNLPGGTVCLADRESLQVQAAVRAYVTATADSAMGVLPERLLPGWQVELATRDALSPKVLADPPDSLRGRPLRVVPGPYASLLRYDEFYEPTVQSDRRGVRLRGGTATHGLSLTSRPTVPGAIQITPDGTLIILGPDGPTIGGYPVVATVCDADLDRVGQMPPMEPIWFVPVDAEEADRLALARLARLRSLATLGFG